MPRDLIGGRIVCDKIARVGMKHVQRLKRHVLEVGDSVFSRRGDLSRFAVVTPDESGWLCVTGCIRIRLNCPDVEIGYSRRYLEQESVGKWLLHQAKGITMPNLKTTIVRDLPFVYPVLGGNGINGWHDEYLFEDSKVVVGRVGVYCGCVHISPPQSWITDNALYVAEQGSRLAFVYLVHALTHAKLNQYASQSG